jgi:hypothetical protein
MRIEPALVTVHTNTVRYRFLDRIHLIGSIYQGNASA